MLIVEVALAVAVVVESGVKFALASRVAPAFNAVPASEFPAPEIEN